MLGFVLLLLVAAVFCFSRWSAAKEGPSASGYLFAGAACSLLIAAVVVPGLAFWATVGMILAGTIRLLTRKDDRLGQQLVAAGIAGWFLTTFWPWFL